MPTIADVVMRVRVNADQVKSDVDSGLKRVDTKGAGSKAGGEYGEEFSKSSSDTISKRTRGTKVGPDGKESGGKFGEDFARGFTLKRAAIGLAVTGALAVGPAGIAVAGAAMGVAFSVAAGAAIYKNLTTQLKAANKDLAAAEKSKNKDAIANANLQIQALQAQIDKYRDVKDAVTGLRATLIDVGTSALLNSGALEQMAGAANALGEFVSSHAGLFREFFSAAAPYISDFTVFFIEMTKTLLPLFSHIMEQARPAVQAVLDALLGFVRTGIAPFLTSMAANAGVSAKAFGAILQQLVPLLPLIAGMAGIAAKLIIAFPQLTYVVLGLVAGFKLMLLAQSVSTSLIALTGAEGIAEAASIGLSVAMRAIPFVLIATALIALTVVIIKYHAEILHAILATWNTIYANVVKPVISWFSVTIPNAFTALVGDVKRTLGTWAPILATLLLGPVAGAVVFIATHWNTVKSDTTAAFNAVESFLRGWSTRVQGVFSGAYRAIVSSTFTPLENLVTRTLPGWFGTAVSAVSRFWGGIQNAVLSPVKWVFANVIDRLAGGFDDVTNALGLGKPIPAQVVKGWATGGRISQGTTSTADDVLARVSRNETIVSAAHSRVLAPAFAALGVPGYASGGVPVGITTRVGPGANISGPAPGVFGTISNVIGKALDVGKIAAAIATGNSTALTNAVTALIGHPAFQGSGEVLKIATAIPGQIVKDAVHFLLGSASKLAGSAANVPNVGSGVARWTSLVDTALTMLHEPLSLAKQVLYQMQTESGGNPNAINLTDSNALAGDPSRGLLQTIMSTFLAYHVPGTSTNIYDPLANIAAAINYAIHRYGPSLMSGGMGMGSGHGYAMGGWVNEPVYGIGASGQRYSFAEHESEYMMSGGDMKTMIGLLRNLNAVTAAVPAAVGRHVGGAINGAAADAAFYQHYPRAR